MDYVYYYEIKCRFTIAKLDKGNSFIFLFSGTTTLSLLKDVKTTVLSSECTRAEAVSLVGLYYMSDIHKLLMSLENGSLDNWSAEENDSDLFYLSFVAIFSIENSTISIPSTTW